MHICCLKIKMVGSELIHVLLQNGPVFWGNVDLQIRCDPQGPATVVNRENPGVHCYWEKATPNMYIFISKHEQDIR